MSLRVSIQRERRESGAKAISSSFAGSGSGVACRAEEAIAGGAGVLARQHRIPACCGRDGGRRRELARPGAALIEGRHGLAPVAGGHLALGGGELELHELFRFGEGGRRDGRSGVRRGAEGRRRAGRRRGGFRGGLAAGRGDGHEGGGGTAQKVPARIGHGFSEPHCSGGSQPRRDQASWRRTARGEPAIVSYQTVIKRPSAGSTVEG